MGYDARAVLMVGVEIDRKKLYKSVPGCNHSHTGKFCPECGAPARAKDDTTYIDGYDGCFLGGLPVVFQGKDTTTCIVGIIISETEYDHKMIHRSIDTLCYLDKWRKRIKEVLEPHYLWNENHYGLWTLLVESY